MDMEVYFHPTLKCLESDINYANKLIDNWCEK